MTMFDEYHNYLFSIAYRMLGSVSEAEDIIQEAYLRFREEDETQIQSPKAFLSTIVTRLCLDTLKSARVQRESYIGPWLPEPLLTPDEPAIAAERSETISTAFLVLLEKLSANERAVFLLREVFDYDYEEIARILQKEEASCRKLFSRAKQHLSDNRPRFESSSEAHEEIVSAFIAACQSGDLQGIERLLAKDVISMSDGGGKASAATRPLFGRERVAQLWASLSKYPVPNNLQVEITRINNEPGFIFKVDNQAILSIAFDIHNGLIQHIWAMRNPDKLKHL